MENQHNADIYRCILVIKGKIFQAAKMTKSKFDFHIDMANLYTFKCLMIYRTCSLFVCDAFNNIVAN